MTSSDEVLVDVFKRMLRAAPTASWEKDGDFMVLTLHDPEVRLNGKELAYVRTVLDNSARRA